VSESERKRSVTRTLLVVGLVAAAVGGGIWLWEEVLEDRLIPKRWGVVEQGAVYRSGQLSGALVEKTLRDHSIRVVVSLRADEPGNEDHEAERAAVERLGIDLLVFPLQGDGTGDVANYAKAIEAMVEARAQGKPVVVHCAAGAYRTGGVVAAYRLLVEGADPADVYEEMLEYDYDPDDENPPAFLNAHMAELAALLVERGVIDAVPDPLPVLGP
jgi:protein tyrosine/serine phosphatase